MKITLRSNENYTHFACIDTSDVSFFEDFKSNDEQSLSGIYSFVGEKIICLFKKSESLFLRVNNFDIALDNTIRSKIENTLGKNTFYIIKNNIEIINIDYDVNHFDSDGTISTPFSEAEDFDFLLFINNIIKNKERQEVMLDEYE